MAKVVSLNDAFDGAVAWLLSDGRGRTMQVRVVDSASFAASWATVLAIGNTSGGSNVVISGTDELQFSITPGTGLIRIADELQFVANGVDALFIDDTAIEIGDGLELQFSTSPGPAIVRYPDSLMFARGADVLLLDTQIRPQVGTMRWTAASAPMITQETTAVGAAPLFTLQGGESTGGAGGQVLLQGGTGSTNGASITIVGGQGVGALGGNARMRGGLGATVNGSALIQQPNGTTAITVTTAGLSFWGGAAAVAPSVTGSRGGNAALASLLTQLANMGLITNNTTA
jgi:hypothetical protein